MKELEKYDISIFNLDVGVHDFEFSFDDSFFQEFDEDLVNRGTGKVNVTLSRTSTMIESQFAIKGSVELTCDRSLDKFDYPVDLLQDMIYKFGEEEAELSEEIVMIPWETQTINVAQYIYEFIVTSIPMKKLHPRYSEEESDQEELVYTSGSEDGSREEETDPRWEALKKLKNKE